MNRKLKLALLTLLGFSPACSTVKNVRTTVAPKSADTVFVRSDTLRQMIRVMYGVRSPLETQNGGMKPADSSDVVVNGYATSPHRMMVAYGVRSPKDSIAAEPDSVVGFKCIMPRPPKEMEPEK